MTAKTPEQKKKRADYMRKWYWDHHAQYKKWRDDNREKLREASKAQNAKHRPRVVAYMKSWRAENRGHRNMYKRKYYAQNKDRINARRKEKYARQRDHFRNQALSSKYGMTSKQYDTLLATQNGVCAICRKPETRMARGRLLPLSVDHCHRSGENRGLLCSQCNPGLGNFTDSPKLLRAAAAYLESF